MSKNGLRACDKTRDRRGDDGTHFRERHHSPQVTEMKRSFADH